MHQGGGHNLAVALTLLDGDHALGAPAMARVFGDAGAFAIAVQGGGEHTLLLVFGHQHGDHTLPFVEHHAAHTTGVAAHGAHVVFVETHGLATVAEQHHVVLAVGQRGADQEVAFVQVHRNNAGLARVAEVVQRCLLDGAHAGGHKDVLVFGELARGAGQGQHYVDLFTLLQREHVDDRASARAA